MRIKLLLIVLTIGLCFNTEAQDFDGDVPLRPTEGYQLFTEFDSSISKNDIVSAFILADSVLETYEGYWGSSDLKVALVSEKMAVAFSNIYQLNESTEFAKRAIAIYQKHTPVSLGRIANLYLSLGNMAHYQSLHNRALDYFDKALVALKQINTNEAKEKQLLLFIEIGKTNYELGNFEAAIENYQQAKALLSSEIGSEQNHNIAAIYTQIGYAYAEIDSLEKSLSYLHKGEGVLRNIFGTETADHVEIHKSMATIHFKNRQLDSTMVYAQKVLDYYGQNPEENRSASIEFKQFLARIYFWAEAFETSAYWHKKYLEAMSASGMDQKSLAHLHLQIAGTFLSKMSMHHALTFYEKGLEMYEQAPDQDPLTLASLFTSVSDVYNKMTYYEKAVDLQVRAALLYEAQDSLENEIKIDAYLNTAALQLEQKQTIEAIAWLNKALVLVPKVNNLKAAVWNQLARAHYQSEDYEQALLYAIAEHDFYMEVYEGIHVNTAGSFLLLGNIQTHLGEQDIAYELYQKALQYNAGIFDQTDLLALDANRFLSYIYRIKGNHSKADQHALLAMRIQRGIKENR